MDVSMDSPSRTSPHGFRSVSYVGLVGRKRAHSPEWSPVRNSHQGRQFSLGIDWDSIPNNCEGSDDSGPDVKRLRIGSSNSNCSSRGWSSPISPFSYCQTQLSLGSDEMDMVAEESMSTTHSRSTRQFNTCHGLSNIFIPPRPVEPAPDSAVQNTLVPSRSPSLSCLSRPESSPSSALPHLQSLQLPVAPAIANTGSTFSPNGFSITIQPGTPTSITPSRRSRMTMGPRADCEKCRMKVPGHWMHVDQHS